MSTEEDAQRDTKTLPSAPVQFGMPSHVPIPGTARLYSARAHAKKAHEHIEAPVMPTATNEFDCRRLPGTIATGELDGESAR